MPRIITAAIAALVWLGTFIFHLWLMDLYNDHFDRIARGRQIARYGELPFRDFLDPGYFLTELSSAAVQRMFGDRLLGEMLLTGAAIATGAVIVMFLARRASGSAIVGVLAAVVAVLLLPRPYDYDKFLFYPLGILLCWRYVDRQRVLDLVLLAAGLVLAALFRYDSAAYVGVAAGAALIVLHARAPLTLVRRGALLAALVLALTAPALVFIETHGGLRDAIDQVVTYGVREARPLQLVVFDPEPADVAPIFRMRMPPQLFNSRPAGVLYFCMMALPIVAGVVLVVRRLRTGGQPATDARWWSLIAMCVALNLFILRPPMMARIGGMAGPAAVLAAWIAAQAWGRPSAGTRQRRSLSIARRAAVVAALALVVWTVSVAANWEERFRSDAGFVERLRGNLAAMSESPPDPRRLSAPLAAGLAGYLRACTAPDDAVFATWFAPEIAFFAQRRFGARMAETWQWADMRFQRRTGEALASRPTVVVLNLSSYDDFAATYPLVDAYLRQGYRTAGQPVFANATAPDGYQLLVAKDRMPTRRYTPAMLPCFN